MSIRTGQSAVGLIVVLLGPCLALSQTKPEPADQPVRVYEVNKRVSSFPDKDDFSTPESAYVVVNRTMAAGQEGKWPNISVSSIASRLPSADAPARKLKPEDARTWLDAKIIEVRVFRGIRAVVIAKIGYPSGRFRYDYRSVELESGRWLNSGQNVFDTIEEARLCFTRQCAESIGRPKRPAIADPDAHLKSFVDFLASHAQEPKPFVMKALASHKLVIMGEIHHRPLYLSFNSSLVSDPEFPRIAGTIFLELPANDQPLVDRFLSADTLDTAPVIEMLRDMMEFGWPDQPTLDLFTAVWKTNRTLPQNQKLRIVLADMERPWKEIRSRADLMQREVDRDRYMADAILRDFGDHPDEKRNALFIVGAGHTMLNLRYFDGTPIAKAGYHLRNKLGREHVFAFIQHTCMMTNNGRVDGRLALGLFESAFATVKNKPMAFPLDTGPFGEEPFDAFPDTPATGRYRDGYDAYIYLGPLESEGFSPLIPGFYTDEFVKEVDRRYHVINGKGWGQMYDRDLTGESFVKWLSSTWGRPRRQWSAASLGPLDAWKKGSRQKK